jgi:Ice-binding-like
VNHGVPQMDVSPLSGPSAASSPRSTVLRKSQVLIASLATSVLFCLVSGASALGATPSVGLGSAASFSVLAGSTVTNTGPTTMFGDLGLSPGSSVTGAPHVLGATHVDDAVSIGAKSNLTTAYNDAASRPANGSAGTDLSGQTFTPGVRSASSSLLLSAGTVTLDAQGNPNAVFIFQIGSTLITGSNTSVSLINGAQACNVFWQVGSSATLGTGTRFVGTVMAAETITAGTGATIHGRLLASTAAVNLDTNTITTSNCASSATGGGGGLETTTLTEEQALVKGATTKPGEPTTNSSPIGSRTQLTRKQREAKRRAAARRAAARRHRHHPAAHRHTQARPVSPTSHGGLTG